MEYQFARNLLTFGAENMEKLSKARVIVFGIGGVGSYVVEALVRSGIGAIDVVDDDKICVSNINRQLYALYSTVGRNKVDVAEERIKDINPQCIVTKHKIFYLPETADQFDFSKYDYIVDCIDTVKGKLDIIERAKSLNKPVISCMGAGNKVNPGLLQVADISRTTVCPLARVMRNELKKRGIKGLKCVFSTEPVIPPFDETGFVEEGKKNEAAPLERGNGPVKKQTPGSNAFVPGAAGLMIASEVIKDLTDFHVTKLF